MTNTPTPLSDSDLEFICGGNQGSYMTDLSAFVRTAEPGQYFTFQFEGASYSLHTAATDEKFALIISKAEKRGCGSVTFIAESGASASFTIDQLKGMQ